MSWKKVSLDKAADVIAGQSPPSETYNKEGVGLPFFQGKADFGEKVPKVRTWCSKPQKVALPDDILLSVRAPVGPTNVCDQKSCIGRGLSAIRAKSGLDNSFLLYFFKHIEPSLSIAGVGSTFSAITINDVKNLQIPLPTLATQKHIASILDKADAVRRQNRQLLEHYDALLQSTFIEMFGDPVTNPKGWEVKRLGDVTKLIQIGPFGSLLHQEDYISGGIPLINPTHISDLKIIPNHNLTVSKQKYDELKNYHLQEHDIVMGRRGEMGRCAIVSKKEAGWLCGTGSLFIRPQTSLSSFFLVYLLSNNKIKTMLESVAQGVTMANLNSKVINALNIINPPTEVQERFGKAIEQIESQKQQTQAALTESEALFQGLLAKYFGDH